MPDALTLDRAPALLPQYLRAVVPGFGARSPSPPDVVLRLAGVRPDPGHVARYAAVVGQPASGQLPLLYPHMLGFGMQLRLMTDPRFPFPALGLVHLTNEVVARRALPVDAALDVEVRAGEVRPHARGRTVDLLTTVHVDGPDGEAVWAETSTYLHRSASAAPAAGSSPESASQSASQSDGVPAPALHPSARWRLAADLGRRYAAVSGDRNPIHLYPVTARAFGFRTTIVHGMWTAAAVVAAFDGRLPDAVRYGVQFKRPVALPSTVWLDTAVCSGPGDAVRAHAVVRGADPTSPALMTATAQSLD